MSERVGCIVFGLMNSDQKNEQSNAFIFQDFLVIGCLGWFLVNINGSNSIMFMQGGAIVNIN